MLRRLRITVATVATASILMTTFGVATVSATHCTEGCTPGYWKNHLNWPSEYDPDVLFNDIFEDVTQFNGQTLEDVLNNGGGGIYALGRHTVAALLNAAAGLDFGQSTTDVIDAFNAVYPNGDFEDLKDEFEAANSRDCPNPAPRER